MKRFYLILFLLFISYHSCIAQGIIETVGHLKETDINYYTIVSEYVKGQTDLITLNSIIEVNGIVHTSNTYGYIDYFNAEGKGNRCYFLHWGGIINIPKRDYDEIVKLPDSSKIVIAICLQSPVRGEWGMYWDRVLVKGRFDASQLVTTRSTMLSPCFHFIITSYGKELFKIQFYSWKVQTDYYSTNSNSIASRLYRRLDRKELRIYNRAKNLHFERELW